MKKDAIAEIGIGADGRLRVTPATQLFPYVHREAMEVGWDDQGGFLYSPRPREWSYLDWFHQILKAAQEQQCQLCVDANTKWINIELDLKEQIISGR